MGAGARAEPQTGKDEKRQAPADGGFPAPGQLRETQAREPASVNSFRRRRA